LAEQRLTVGSAKLSDALLNVRSGSKADIGACVKDVRFTPKNAQKIENSECPLSAKSGHMDAS